MSNYQSMTLRSGVTVGTSQQDAAVTLPETVNEIWVLITKTAEADPDNLLTARIQAQVASTWFDVAWTSLTDTQVLTTVTDITSDVTSKVNLCTSDSTLPTWSKVAHYASIPSNVLRVASITSGTTPVNTFAVTAYFMAQKVG